MKWLCASGVSLALILAGCTTQETADEAVEATAGEQRASAGATALKDLVVSQNVGAEATVAFPGPLPADSAGSLRLVEGTGPASIPGQVLRIQYTIFDAATGEKRGSTYADGPTYLVLRPESVDQTFVAGLTGAKKDSRTVLVRAPAAAGADQEAQNARVVVVDVLAVLNAKAAGKAVKPSPKLPKVTLAKDGVPTVSIPKTKPPKKLLVQTLQRGTGAPVTAGQRVSAMYLGVKWADGRLVDSTWKKRYPRDFPIGVGKVIQAWDVALVGQTVGSQVLIVVPPSSGYGKAGNPAAGIGANDTLVYVVDILDAY